MSNKYQAPQIKIYKIQLNELLSSLNSWLTENSLESAGIATYVINS